ncbi:hypothetical protein tb265_27870 [Gemmatimonadetes bacterium T265]|nr:hypothetical protein tb265_27870 [Gemmatimonadetes bacterium T265]
MRRAARACAGLAFVGAVAGGTAAAQPQPAVPVRVGATRTPDTVRVGDPFRVLLRVAAPAGARVDFPAGADSAAPVEVIAGPRQRASVAAGGGVDVTAEYTVVAWTTGPVPIALDSVTVRAGTAVRRVATPPIGVFVRSVLPADSAQRTPKPPRDPLPDLGLWWLPYAAVALAVLALIAFLVLLARRGRRRGAGHAAVQDAYARALAGFDALDRRGLVALGEGGRHVALAVDVLRDYLVARFPGVATASQTGGELAAALAARDEVPVARLGQVLAAGDLVKFAAVAIAPAHAAGYAAEARAVVVATETAVRVRETREAAEAAARAQADAEARRTYEAERRRRGRAADAAAAPDREDRAA